MGDLKASYRLVYFQPDPEDGERVSVALLFTANSEVDLLYDPEFRRLRCLSPRTSPDIVRFYLDDLKTRLKEATPDIDGFILAQSPYLVTSEKRKVAWPLTDKIRLQLIERFLNKGSEVPSVVQESKPPKIDIVNEHLRRLLTESAKISPGQLQENAKSEFILGRRVPQIRSVAFALRRDNGVILIDGVDLNFLSPQRAVNRAGRVAYTFFQYGRERQLVIYRSGVKRIGVVLNGASHRSPALKDAHDFALREFTQEADLAIDASSPDQLQRLKHELARQQLS